MGHVDAVVCHAGHNTVCEALACAVPLVLAPVRDDQPLIAEQVAVAGAGLRLRFTYANAEHIGRALDPRPYRTLVHGRRIADPRLVRRRRWGARRS
jgi:hypothetical protein